MAALVGVMLVGCGDSGGEPEAAVRPPAPDQLRVTLDSFEGPENIGVLMAAQRGYFEDVGLKVTVANPLEPNRPVSYVAKGTDDIGLVQQPQVDIGKEKGMPIVEIGKVIDRPTDSLIWLKRSGIEGVEDLEGKTIAVPGIPYQERFLRDLLERRGLRPGEVEIERLPYGLTSALLSGEADAIFGATWNMEGAELEARGAEPVITRFPELGFPDYEELVVIAASDLAENYPGVVRRFMAAVEHGTADAVGHPRLTAETIIASPGSDSAAGRKVLEAQARATLPLLSTAGE